MGKADAAEMKKKKRKRGRPSLSDLHHSSKSSRSGRRNPNSVATYSDSDSDERIQKKLKLVERLPSSSNSASPSSPVRSAPEVVKAEEVIEEPLQGSPLESGPTAPLPDKKLLVFILDRLQKKDTYGVYSEPVDIDELTDYLEIIERPMDFGTVRKKLDEQSYSNLDDFESDVLLICANGMQYNAPDTVYYRQAKSIQEIAKRDFQNLRQVNDEGVPQPKVVRRGRPPNLKKALTSPPERVGPESSSDATLATAGDNNNNIDDHKSNIDNNAVGSNSYNLRKGLAASLRQSNDPFSRASPQSRNNETYADYTTDWNSEFPASILKAEAKHTKKTFTTDESRRTTYKQCLPHDSSSLNIINGNAKHLIGVGLHSEHGYARSLARFAANLGPEVWKIASKKIESILPSGVHFGPGWVGENDAISSQPQPSILPLNTLVHSNNSSHVQAGSSQMPCNEQSVLRNSVSTTASGQVRNGFNNLSGIDFQTQAEILRARLNLPTGQKSGAHEAHPSTPNLSTPEPIMGVSSGKSPQNLAYSNIIPVPPDLNVRFQAPGSPFQPDLALQL